MMLIRCGLNSYDGGKHGGGCGAAQLDRATVAMVHARVPAARRGYRAWVRRHATGHMGMAQRRPGQRPELKQKEQSRENLHCA